MSVTYFRPSAIKKEVDMALTREQLIEMAVDKYFIGSNNHDAAQMCSVLSEDCVMRFSAAKYVYYGRKAIFDHLDDFATSFKIVNFHSFVNVVDVPSQSIAVRFQVDLEDHEGDKLTMFNCNFFQANEDGLFNDCLIFNSAPIKKGFEVGSAV